MCGVYVGSRVLETHAVISSTYNPIENESLCLRIRFYVGCAGADISYDWVISTLNIQVLPSIVSASLSSKVSI